MNKIFLTGNLTREPEGSTTPNNINVCKFTIAVQRKYSGKDGENKADFFRVTVWRGLADNCTKYLNKGSKVAVVGSLELQEYEDKEGIKKLAVNVNADEVEFLSRKEASGEPVPQGTKSRVDSLPTVDDDDLPF